MINGGQRTGAGRPKGSKDKKTLEKQRFVKMLFDAAIGDNPEFFEMLPLWAVTGQNTPIIKLIIELYLGKPAQAYVLDGIDEEALSIAIVNYENSLEASIRPPNTIEIVD